MMDQRRPRFVIIEKDAFIARDLGDGLKAALPDSEIVIVARHEDAWPRVFPPAQDDVWQTIIVTKLTLAQLDECGLSRRLEDSGTQVVVRVGDDPVSAVAERGWISLASPFTGDDLSSLAGLLSTSRCAA